MPRSTALGQLDRCIAAVHRQPQGAALVAEALTRHMPDGSTSTTPTRLYIWLTVPGATTPRPWQQARAKQVAYVPGSARSHQALYAQIRLSTSRVADDLIDEEFAAMKEVLSTVAEGR